MPDVRQVRQDRQRKDDVPAHGVGPEPSAAERVSFVMFVVFVWLGNVHVLLRM